MKQCLECGNNFDTKSELALYCSAKCKQKRYRKNLAEVLKELRSGKIISAKVVKEGNKHKAEVKIELPKKNNELSDFWKQRMKNKLGI